MRHFRTKLISDLLRHAGHHPALDEPAQRRDEIQADQLQQDGLDLAEIDTAGPGDFRHESVGQLRRRIAQDLRSDDHERHGDDRKQEGDDDVDPVRTQIADQLGHSALEVFCFFCRPSAFAMAHGAAAHAG